MREMAKNISDGRVLGKWNNKPVRLSYICDHQTKEVLVDYAAIISRSFLVLRVYSRSIKNTFVWLLVCLFVCLFILFFLLTTPIHVSMHDDIVFFGNDEFHEFTPAN